MKNQVKTPFLVAVVVLVVGGVAYFGFKTVGDSGNLDHGQVKYTPGKPPWMETDPSKKGPGGAPPVAGSQAPLSPGMPGGPPKNSNGQ